MEITSCNFLILWHTRAPCFLSSLDSSSLVLTHGHFAQQIKNSWTHFRFHQSQSKLGLGVHIEWQRVLTSYIYICSLEISNKSTFKCCRRVSMSHHCHWEFHPNEEWSNGLNSHQKPYSFFQKIQHALRWDKSLTNKIQESDARNLTLNYFSTANCLFCSLLIWWTR